MLKFTRNKADNISLNDILEIDPSPSIMLGEGCKVISYNQELADILGDKLLDCSAFNEILVGGGEGFVEELKKLLQNASKSSTSLEIKIDGDAERTFLVTIKKIEKKFLPTGSDARFYVNLIDIGEQKSLEAKLNQSQKMQAVGQLAGGIAHDFNNLLTAMSGFCDLLLQKHPPGDRSFPDIMQIKQNVNRAANLVRQLLAFSRKQVLKPKIIDITDVLSELSNLLRRLLGENVTLEVKHGRDLGKILADPGQIDQVTINLAVNARDAMPHGGKLVIETSNFSVAQELSIPTNLYSPDQEEKFAVGDYVLVKVRDTGTGMSKEILEKVFEPFFSTKEVGAGTGLGLATVYGIVKQTDGYILVRSVEGEGTEFQIYFKRHEATEAELAEVQVVEEVGNADLTGEGTILLVEDEVPVRIFAARALSNKGYKILEAENAEEALQIIRENACEVDLVISDVIMPGMTGPDMVMEIQKEKPDLKIIFMSGYTEDAFVGTGLENADLNFLQKPFNLKDLAAMVKKVMNS